MSASAHVFADREPPANHDHPAARLPGCPAARLPGCPVIMDLLSHNRMPYGRVGIGVREAPQTICVMTTSTATLSKTSNPGHHPSVVAEAEKRSADVQLKVADAITKFAGSMLFVYVHIAVFTIWMLFVEKSPWPTLTLVVSLEAIFLSTFVMIGQNRQADFQQKKADHDFTANELELKSNTELTKMIADLTKQIHQSVCLSPGAAQTAAGAPADDPPQL